MSWFKRIKDGITTSTKEKKEIPEGLWYSCPKCKEVIPSEEHAVNLWVCATCDHHERIGSYDYFSFLFDDGKYRELNKTLHSADPLKFKDTKAYVDRLKSSAQKTGLRDAIRTASGELEDELVVIAAMDFRLMMEAGFSLMQMAKTSARLTQLADAGLPYISLLTDPTTGGVTASFAMLGDLNIAEPHALIGFAGPRVVKETIGKDLPEGFQRSEFVLEHGFLDYIVERKELKEKLALSLNLLKMEADPKKKREAVKK